MSDADNITQRVREFIRYFDEPFGWFEDITGINASKWRDLSREKTKAVTAEMLDALCTRWPEFAYWFVTGNAACARGQMEPHAYFKANYANEGALEWGTREIWRDDTGTLQPSLGNTSIADRRSKEYELSVANRLLFFSGLVNHRDAKILEEKFWGQFLKPIKRNETVFLTNRQMKAWINQFPLHPQID